MTPKGKNFVIALGGSIAFPDDNINVPFLKRFFLFIKRETKKGNKFIIVPGGGGITRRYQAAARRIARVRNEDKDWLGIHATRLNAHFLRTIFKDWAEPVILDERGKIVRFGRYSIIIASGWKPGWSTDYVACQIALDFGIREVINLSEAGYVYTADIKKDPRARPIKQLFWDDYLKLIPSRWSPGLHTPVDPVAARLAKKRGLRVITVSSDLGNLRSLLKGEGFKGTVLTNPRVVVGGTFEIIHRGHQKLLKRAFGLGDVLIGLTSSKMAESLKKRKVKGFEARKKALETFVKKEFNKEAEIVKIEDRLGSAVGGDFDYIVVSPETEKTALLINKKRKQLKKKPIKIAKIRFVLAEDGKPISDTRILKGEINEEGKTIC